MNPLAESVHAAASALRELGQSFAVVGGLAVSIRGEPRFTRDADFAVAVADDGAAEQLIRDLSKRGYSVMATVEQEAVGRLATVRLQATTQNRGVITDLLFASCGIEPEIVAAAEALTVVPRLVLPVARTGHLIAMKLLARDDRRRPADADDLHTLATVATEDDWALADQGVTAIEERGFARGRDLRSALRVLRDGGAFASG